MSFLLGKLPVYSSYVPIVTFSQNRYVVPGRLRVASEFRNQKSLKMDRHTHHPSTFRFL